MTYEYVHGVETEIQKLQEFPAKVEGRVIRGAVRAAAVVTKNAAATLVPHVSGALADTLRVSTSVRSGEASAKVKVGNPKKGVFYAGMVLGGTAPHLIKGRKSSLSFAGVVRRSVQHPGSRAQPFMAQADAQSREAALRAAFDYADERTRDMLEEQGNL